MHDTTSQTTRPPHAKLAAAGTRDVRWTTGFWADRFRQCCDTMVPSMGRLLTETERVRFLGNFLVAIGEEEGRHRGPKWNDGDFYKWLEAAAAVFAATKSPQLDAQMDRLIAIIGKAQRDDGYIHTDVQIAQRSGDEATKPFGNPLDFEMYNMGHLISAACVHHRATGKTNFLAIARKTANFLGEVFANPAPQQARHGICPSHLMGLVQLYRTTGEARYLQLAEKLLNMRDLVTSGDDDNQDRIPLRQHTKAHGHAVRATYLYAGAADIYAETGDVSLLKPLESVWQDLVSRKLHITGGCGALYDGASPDGTKDQQTITRVHQAFGRDFQLPHSTAHNETCAAIGNFLWNWRMMLISGDARYADIMEQTLYNGILCGVGLDGESYFYTNTLRQLNPMPVELRWPRHRTKFMSCWCCPPNVVRTIAQSSTYAYARSDRGIWCVMYGGNRLETTLTDGTAVKLTQETEYPWDGRIRFTIQQAAEFSLMLRIPAWANGASVRINGAEVQGFESLGIYHEIRRAWKNGDVVELNLPMPPRMIEANPYVEEARNHVAIARGPIVYCLESADLPKQVSVLDVAIPDDAKLETRKQNDLLGGVVTIHTKATAMDRGEWAGRLYRDFSPPAAREIDLMLVPYYAWDNRGAGEMTVWLPLARR